MPVSRDATRVVAAIVGQWLRNTDVGRDWVRQRGFKAAKADVVELLNAGYLKIVQHPDGTVSLDPRTQPEPPSDPLPKFI